ncbi:MULTISPECIES: hypothetical protein [Enterobacteriaceae]|uniref:hypothetical protein n=1 Tax=Enterobacteriaceae TaxID=543 RepID=UPI000750CC5D|nr:MULTISPECIES: hypothetical protein [Enterobacteriaceae]NHJ97686.1 hypothetical protein [Klebsiella quasipneumoniae subsp. similipneumoniae]KUR00385.1 hypothetical protein AWI31_11315 [Enterobacter hormaechei subsp. xiangfangensis]OZJ73157.1 hypothetical protein CEO93_23305 [Klebsiella pneumoniae]OZJ90025.1 hypothetical protein CEO90_23300 [Klebsiella pneumoniae]OZJ95421.1 hypothetical protein CEO89_23305 [Klebsiella pneumoniae]
MNMFSAAAAVITLLAGLVSSAVSAENDAIKVDIQKSGWECNDCVYVTVTARTERIQIKNIDVNRGKCPQLKQGKTTYNGKTTPEGWWPNKGTFTPRKMQFAESLTWRFGNPLWQTGISCNFLEARIFTDQGTFTVSD